ncbi:MAG: acyl carrier protein [Planctomycetota bacterium]|jgi:acyl carrier protein
MDLDKFVRALEGVLQIDANTLSPESQLEGLESWDSMGVLEFQALADEDLGVQVEPTAIEACKTVTDLWNLVSEGQKS